MLSEWGHSGELGNSRDLWSRYRPDRGNLNHLNVLSGTPVMVRTGELDMTHS